MKKLLFLLPLCAASVCAGAQTDEVPCTECITKDGYFRGKKLAGRVKIVESHADFDVKVETSFQDLSVKPVESFPNNPGEWQFVESFPDFTIRFVESFPDFTIKYVESFPGVERPCR